MRKMLLALVVALWTCAASAQAPEVGTVYKPGDTVRIVVSFKTPVSLDGGQFYFYLKGDPQENQKGFATEFGGSKFTKLSDAEYEIAGAVSAAFASGEWQLRIVDAASSGVRRRYNFGAEFTKEVVIRIVNPKHVRFPEIKDVTVKPPR